MNSVDVVVPCFRYGHFLRECVQSVLMQSDVQVRVLIIDDASPDNTAEIGVQLAGEDGRVTFLKHVTNKGNIASYNEGIEWCSSDHLLILSADDYLVPGSLARSLAVFDAHPEVVLTYGRVLVAQDGQPLPDVRYVNSSTYTLMSGENFVLAACDGSDNSLVWAPTAVVRTSAQKAVGGYNKDIPYSADVEVWLRLAQIGSVARLDSCQAVYRRHASNMHYGNLGVRNFRQQLLAFESALANYSVTHERKLMLRQKYRRGLALGAIRWANHALNENDAVGFQESVSFAREILPEIRNSGAWHVMQLRRMLGRRVVNLVRRVVRPTLEWARRRHTKPSGLDEYARHS